MGSADARLLAHEGRPQPCEAPVNIRAEFRIWLFATTLSVCSFAISLYALYVRVLR